jgi:hypothetical protein
MAKSCTVAVNGQTFKAKAGDVLLDAALVSGVNISHDCRSGVCGSCLTKVVRGSTILGKQPFPAWCMPARPASCRISTLGTRDLVCGRACQCASASGPRCCGSDRGARKAPALSARTIFQLQVCGFPARSYSPTRPLNRRPRAQCLTLQIRRHERGQVSSQIGREIRAGHAVAIEGPFGSAFFREGKSARLILASSGTGFAPIWSIACAALRENPYRQIFVIAGVRTDDPIYMSAALERLALSQCSGHRHDRPAARSVGAGAERLSE